MNKEAIDQAMDKAVNLIKNNDLRDKIFKGFKRVCDNKSQHEPLLFLKQDFSKNRNSCFDLFDKYYKLTVPVSGDGHCGPRSAALAMGLCKENKDLTEQDIINLRKEFREIAAERKCDGGKGLDQFESNNWVYDGPLAAVTNVKGNKPCLVVSKKDGEINLSFSNDGNIKRIAESSYHLEDFMNEIPDDMIVILLNENHFQPLDIKKINYLEFITKLIKAEFLFKAFGFLDPSNYPANSNLLPSFGDLKGMIYALFKQQEAELIIKNIKGILNFTPEPDKLSVLLAIAEELCQEFNARIEKFKANKLEKKQKMNEEVIDQAMDKAVDLINKNNDLRNKIFKGCEIVCDNKSKHEKLLFLKKDFSKPIKYPDDFFYKYTDYVPGDGNCGIYSMALELGVCKDPKELTQQNIADLRKRFYETAKKIGCSEDEQKQFKQDKAWVKNTGLVKVLSVESNKKCLLFCNHVNYGASFFLFGVNGEYLVFPYHNEFSLGDLMLNMDDMPIVFMNTNHFQPLTRKDELKRREAVILITDNLFYSSLMSFKINFKAKFGKAPWIIVVDDFKSLVLKALLPIQKANQIEKNIDEILNSTPESDKLSVLLAIAEELCQEFNAMVEKFKANKLNLEKNNNDAEPQKNDEGKINLIFGKQKNNSDQANDAKSEQLENKTDEKNKSNELDNDTHKQKDNSGHTNDIKTEQSENKIELKKKSDEGIIEKLDDLVKKSQTLETFEKDLDQLYKTQDKESKNLIEDNKIQKELESVFNKDKPSAVFYKIGKDTEVRQKELARLKRYFIICIVFSNMSQQDKNKMIVKVKNADKANVFRYILSVLKNFFTGNIAAAFSPKIVQSLNTLSELEKKISPSPEKLPEDKKSGDEPTK